MLQNQDFEGQNSGITVTVGNSGGGNNTAYTTVNSTSATVQYDSTHPMHGVNGVKFMTSATSVVANALQTFTGVATAYGRFYVWTTDWTSTQNGGARLRASGVQTLRICFDSTGHITFHDTGNSTTGMPVGSVALSNSTYYRIEWMCTPGTSTTGVATANVYIGDSLTLVDTITTSSANFGTAAITEYGIGFFTATANINPWWFDNTNVNDTGFPGPSQVWMPGIIVRVSKFFGLPWRWRRGVPMAAPFDQSWVYQYKPSHPIPAQARARARISSPVLTQTPVIPPAYPPAPIRRGRWTLGRIRGKASTVVPAQVIVAPGYVPAPVHRLRLALGRLRRITTAAPVPVQQGVGAGQVRRSRASLLPWRRTRLRAVTPAVTAAPTPARGRRPAAPAALMPRHRSMGPIVGQVIVNPAKTPQPVIKRPLMVRLFGGRTRSSVPLVGLAPPSTNNITITFALPQPKWSFGPSFGQTAAIYRSPVAMKNPIAKWLTNGGSQFVLALPSVSLEYVRVPVTAASEGVYINPTSNVVKMAFIVGTAYPGVSDWKTAIWDQTASPTTTYVAQCLVGPGGAVTLAVGIYQVWVQIVDAPELVVRPVGTLNIT